MKILFLYAFEAMQIGT